MHAASTCWLHQPLLLSERKALVSIECPGLDRVAPTVFTSISGTVNCAFAVQASVSQTLTALKMDLTPLLVSNTEMQSRGACDMKSKSKLQRFLGHTTSRGGSVMLRTMRQPYHITAI